MAGNDGYQTPRRLRKFTQAGALLGPRLRQAGGKRGFAETRLLTRWEEVCGADVARISRPVKVSYGRSGFGATLILACEGARAPEVMMQAEQIRERVNACYGYNAIARIRLQQQDSDGFAAAQRGYQAGQAPSETKRAPSEAHRRRAEAEVEGVASQDLAEALKALGTNILARKSAPDND